MINTGQPIKTVWNHSTWNHSTAVQNDEISKKEHENKSAEVAKDIIGKTPKNEIKIVTKITDTKSPKESLQEWWKLSLAEEAMPDLSSSDIEMLYELFKGMEKEFENSFNEIDNSLLSITRVPKKHYLILQIKPQFTSDAKLGLVRTYGDQKINVSLGDFQKFLGGFILSQKQSFFAFTGDYTGLYLFPNMNGKTDDDNVGSLITRQGIQKSIGPDWVIGKDGICNRYIEKVQILNESTEVENLTTERVEESAKKTIIQEASEEMNKTANPIKKSIRKKAIELPVVTAKKSLTPEESVKEWWEFSRGYDGTSCGTLNHWEMPKLSSFEIEKLHTMFKRIEDKFAGSESKMIEDNLFKMKNEGMNSLSIEFNITHRFDDDKSVYTFGEEDLTLKPGEFKKMFGGFILSLDTSFFAFQEGRNHFVIFKNINGNSNDMLKAYPQVSLITREGLQKGITDKTEFRDPIANPPKGSEWRIGSDGVCRLVEENCEKELDLTESSSIEEEKMMENDNISYHCKSIIM